MTRPVNTERASADGRMSSSGSMADRMPMRFSTRTVNDYRLEAGSLPMTLLRRLKVSSAGRAYGRLTAARRPTSIAARLRMFVPHDVAAFTRQTIFPAGTRKMQLVRAPSIAVISASGVSSTPGSKSSTDVQFPLSDSGLPQQHKLKATRLKGGGVNPQEG